jgi:hypothetical protein
MSPAPACFVMSGIAWILWIKPDLRVLLTVADMDLVMQIEAFSLISSFFVTLAASVLSGKAKLLAGNTSAPKAPLLGVLALGGAMAAAIGGFAYFIVYCVSLFLHLLDALKMSGDELKISAGVSMLAIFTFIGLGVLACNVPVPTLGNKYPSVFGGQWRIGIQGQQMLVWACAHFALLGYFHLNKARMFAHLLEHRDPQSPDQTPR